MNKPPSERLEEMDRRAKRFVDDLFAAANYRPAVVERAFQMARSGRFKGVVAIRKALSQEGYLDARSQLDGRFIQRQINALITNARDALSESM